MTVVPSLPEAVLLPNLVLKLQGPLGSRQTEDSSIVIPQWKAGEHGGRSMGRSRLGAQLGFDLGSAVGQPAHGWALNIPSFIFTKST